MIEMLKYIPLDVANVDWSFAVLDDLKALQLAEPMFIGVRLIKLFVL